MKDSWEASDPYEIFMGRWSRLVGQSFIEWLSPPNGLDWLDIGCGTGALSESILTSCSPSKLVAIDQSEEFVKFAQQRLGAHAHCKVGDATDLPLDDNSVDFTVSGLVLNFIPCPGKALQEMKRVTRPGGTLGIYIWDYPGKMEFLNFFWDVAVELNPEASSLHEGRRFPDAHADGLKTLFDNAGFTGVTIEAIEVDTIFNSFDDYWKPFLGGQGPAPSYVLSIGSSRRNKLRDYLKERLPIQSDGTIPLIARAWAVKVET